MPPSNAKPTTAQTKPLSGPLLPQPKTTTSTPAVTTAPSPAASQMVNKDKWRWFKEHKLWLIIAGVIIVLGAAGVLAYFKLHHAKPAPQPVAKAPAAPPPPPKPILAPLTGLPVTAAVAAQPVFGVVIENSPEARPQSGLSQAGVVYETLAEGGITRYMAVFQDQQPTNLGPVRSLRPYFIDWIQEYNNAPIAHAGGSFDALAQVPQLGVKSMNGLNYGSAFRRAGDRFAPHNLYTSTAALLSLMSKLNYTTAPNFDQWARKADSPMAAPTWPTITVNFSYPLFTASYKFDATCDCYNRFLAGAAHIDRNSNKQIQAKNVVVEVIQTSYDAKGHALDTTIGSGKVDVFTDGGVVEGTWKKDSRTGRTIYLDAAGKPIPLNAGNTWVEAIAQTGSVGH